MEAEHINVEEKAIRYVAKAADGSMRDALSLLDQCIAFYLVHFKGGYVCVHAAFRADYYAGQGFRAVCQ